MHKLIRRAILCIAVCTSFSAIANENTGNTTVTNVEVWDGGSIFVTTSETTKTNPASCGYTGTYKVSTNGTERLHTQLLSALVTSTTARLTIYSGGCGSNRPVIVSVALVKD